MAFMLSTFLRILSRIVCKNFVAACSLLLVQAVKLGTSSTLSGNGTCLVDTLRWQSNECTGKGTLPHKVGSSSWRW